MSLLAALCSSRKRLIADTTPLRTPDFRRLWLSGVVTVIGANLTIFAVPVQIYALTQSSAYVGLTGVFAVVPLVVFGLWGGAWADAMDRRVLLIIASCGLAVASVLLWVQAASDDVRGRLQGVFIVVVAGGPRLADAAHGAAAAVVGTTIAAAGGGALVVVGVVMAAAAVPAFVRYRVSAAGDQPGEPGDQPEVERYDPMRGGGRGGADTGTA